MKEEEKELFPKVDKALDKDLLEQLTGRMDARFKHAMAEDFRGPLVENVREVMTGALKTGAERVEEKAADRAGATKAKRTAQSARR